MEQWKPVRERVLRAGESIREVQRETGLHFNTVKKMLAHSSPPSFACPPREKPKVGP